MAKAATKPAKASKNGARGASKLVPLHDRIVIEPEAMTAISVTPSPRSTSICAYGDERSSPAPIAAASGSGARWTDAAPARRAASTTASRSSSLAPAGAHEPPAEASQAVRAASGTDVDISGPLAPLGPPTTRS